MTIQLQMQNTNTEAVNVNIYRSNTPIDRTNLGTPIGTLTQVTDSTLVFNDTTAVQDLFYYYVFETIGSKDRQISRNIYLQATRTRGEGPNILQLGDDNLGYFGSILLDTLIGAQSLVNLILPSVPGALAVGYATNWHKFSRKGKVLYVPNGVLGQNVSRTQLANAGAVDGTLVYNYNGNAYKVRLMTGYGDVPGSTPPFSATRLDYETQTLTCEFNDLVYPLGTPTPNGQKLPNILNQPPTPVNGGMGFGNTDTAPLGGVLCSEISSQTGNGLARGASNTGRLGLSAAYFPAIGTQITNNWWMPVLELVEN